MSESGQEALLDVREWLEGSPGCPAVVGRPFRISIVVLRRSRMFGSGRDALPDD